MFIRFFKSSFFIQYCAIALIGLSLWVGAFLWPAGMPAPSGPVPVYSLIYTLFSEFPTLASVLGFLLILGEAYAFNRIFDRHELTVKNTSLTALLYVVMMSGLPAQLTLNPANIVLVLMIYILHHLLIYFNKPDHLDRVFAAGFFTSIGFLVYLPFLPLFVLVIIIFLIFRAGSWRAWIASLIGLATPLIYLSSWYIWNDEWISRIMVYAHYFTNINLVPRLHHTDFWILCGYTTFLMLWGVFLLKRKQHDRTVEIRVKTNIILWVLFLSILSITLSESMMVYHFTLTAPALSMILGNSLTHLKKNTFAELLLILLYVSMIANNLILHRWVY